MILTADYHTHTPYSHGKNTVAENVAAAVEKGLKEVAITDHGFSHLALGIHRREMPAFMAECRAAEQQYGIRVLRGIEANVLGIRGKADLKESDFENFDVYLCGYHVAARYVLPSDWFMNFLGNVFTAHLKFPKTKALIKRNTLSYIRTIQNNPIDILTHLNFQCVCDTLEVAKCAADYGTYIELNSKKVHLSDEQLMEIVDKTSARFVVDSDAHTASRVGDTALVQQQLSRLNFPMDRIDNIDGRLPNFRFTEFKKHL
ncbi:MAG: PHP domain-containing protein [Clostridia bacterium]|nr:PHP domain-containing protein [Clostridia bacterium]